MAQSIPKLEVRAASVFTFKEGLLARLAHDLHFEISAFEIEQANETQFETVRVKAKVKDIKLQGVRVGGVGVGHDDLTVLSISDRKRIMESLLTEVFHEKRNPEIVAEFDVEVLAKLPDKVSIRLTLNGQTRQVTGTLTRDPPGSDRSGQLVFDVHQPDFGIQPFQAAFGAIKIQSKVKVQVSWCVKS